MDSNTLWKYIKELPEDEVEFQKWIENPHVREYLGFKKLEKTKSFDLDLAVFEIKQRLEGNGLGS